MAAYPTALRQGLCLAAAAVAILTAGPAAPCAAAAGWRCSERVQLPMRGFGSEGLMTCATVRLWLLLATDVHTGVCAGRQQQRRQGLGWAFGLVLFCGVWVVGCSSDGVSESVFKQSCTVAGLQLGACRVYAGQPVLLGLLFLCYGFPPCGIEGCMPVACSALLWRISAGCARMSAGFSSTRTSTKRHRGRWDACLCVACRDGC